MEISFSEYKKEIKSRDMRGLARYRKQLREDPKLRFLFFELTDSCNMRCRHCGSSCGPDKASFADAGMLIGLLDQLKEDFRGHQFMICLTGGEPLLHPDFWKIVSAINDHYIPWGITTNAALIDPGVAQELKKQRMGSISVSVDGLKEDHEWLRRVPGCFDKAIDGIRNLKNAGHQVQVTTVVNRRNKGNLEEMYKFMRSLEVDSWRVINMEPIGRANDPEMEKYSLDVTEIKELLRFIREKRYDPDNPMDVCYGCSHYLSFGLEREVRDFYFQCGAGVFVASILVNGDIFGCLDIERRPELIQGNIKKDRLYDVWMNRFREYRIDRSELFEMCASCDEREFCGGDFMHTWDFDRNQPRLCLAGREV